MKTRLLIILLLLLGNQPFYGFEIFSRKLNTDNGLPDNNVRSLATDSLGYLWMGTTNGLYRYDGYFVSTYKYGDTGNARLLNNNHITGLMPVDGGSRLLVAEQGGMFSLMDVGRDCFVPMPAHELKAMYEAARKVDTDPAVAQRYSDVLKNGGSVVKDNLGNTVVLDNTGMMWHLDRATGVTTQLRVFSKELWPLVSSKKIKVVASPDGRLLWVSTNGCGITVYDRQLHQQQNLRLGSGLIATDNLVDMCPAGNRAVWVSDEFHGVVLLSAYEPAARGVLLFPADKGLRGNQVYIMHWLKDSTLLVANVSGDVFRADAQLRLQPAPELAGMDIHSLASDRDGRLWVGSRQLGLRSPDGRWHSHQPNDPASLSANNVYSLLCDSGDRLWVACEDGHLDMVTTTADGSLNIRHFFGRHFSPRIIVQDSKGQVWVGTKAGLYAFYPEKLISDTTAYVCRLSAAATHHSDFTCIYEDAEGRIWAGTQGGGVFFTQGKGDYSFTNLTMADGLISDEVQSVIEDDERRIWIGTKKGLACYQPEQQTISYYYDDYNLMRNYYADHCACRLGDGSLAFGTNNGIVVYDTHHTAPRGGQARLHFTDLIVGGEQASRIDGLLPAAPDNLDGLMLAHDQNSLTIRFSTLDFSTTAGTRYSYWLEGYEGHWSEVSPYSFATYKNLPPGRYVLHVKAFGNHWAGSAERTLAITISQPWWRSWWAYLIYMVVALAIGYVVYRQLRTVYRLRQRISIEQQLTELKLQFFTNISHEFRTPLTIIRGAMDRIRAAESVPADLRQPLSSMQKSTDRMLRLVNQLLEFRKMQNGKLRLALEETDVVGFVKDIYLNFIDMANAKQTAYTFLPNVKDYTMFIDRQHVDKMVYNLLSNAFKYTPAKGDIKVLVRVEEPRLTIRVEDSGVGIPKEKRGELFQRFMQSTFSSDSIGIGLHLTKALVDVHHGTISYEENQPQGSVFTITLPTDQSVYAPEDFLQASSLEQQPATAATVQPAYQELMPEPMNDRRVLVVEDDADVAQFIKQTLGRYFSVATASDGQEALALINGEQGTEGKEGFALIVSDVMMPGMDGFELTRRIRGDRRLQATPIILLTALDADDKRLKGTRLGADAYLTKPFDAQLLVATCRQLLEQRDKLRQSYAGGTATQQAAPPQIIVDERDRQLLDLMQRWLYAHLSDPGLAIDDWALAMGYGRSVFYRKVKALTGLTPADYIRTLRMNRAAELLRHDNITVAEVAYKVGISEPHYFSKLFKQQFGVSPKKYQKPDKNGT